MPYSSSGAPSPRATVLLAPKAADMAAPKVFQFKLVLLGDSAVGKSSLVLRTKSQ